ncbi:MAG: uncharacterized protein JWP12_1388 [Bacteroidetes bacterium]|nr:uncharacterized protein [Bacteroidota bacterium]
MIIDTLAAKLNEFATGYKIGGLQRLRQELKGLSKIPTADIFNSSSIDENDKWAFHVGGPERTTV